LVSGRHLLEQVAATFGGVVVARRAAAPIFFACRPGVSIPGQSRRGTAERWWASPSPHGGRPC